MIDKSLKVFKCSLCSQITFSETALAIHTERVHGKGLNLKESGQHDAPNNLAEAEPTRNQNSTEAENGMDSSHGASLTPKHKSGANEESKGQKKKRKRNSLKQCSPVQGNQSDPEAGANGADSSLNPALTPATPGQKIGVNEENNRQKKKRKRQALKQLGGEKSDILDLFPQNTPKRKLGRPKKTQGNQNITEADAGGADSSLNLALTPVQISGANEENNRQKKKRKRHALKQLGGEKNDILELEAQKTPKRKPGRPKKTQGNQNITEAEESKGQKKKRKRHSLKQCTPVQGNQSDPEAGANGADSSLNPAMNPVQISGANEENNRQKKKRKRHALKLLEGEKNDILELEAQNTPKRKPGRPKCTPIQVNQNITEAGASGTESPLYPSLTPATPEQKSGANEENNRQKKKRKRHALKLLGEDKNNILEVEAQNTPKRKPGRPKCTPTQGSQSSPEAGANVTDSSLNPSSSTVQISEANEDNNREKNSFDTVTIVSNDDVASHLKAEDLGYNTLLGPDDVKMALKSLKCPSPTTPLRAVVKLCRIPYNVITISSEGQGKVEVMYTGMNQGKFKFSEWRREVFDKIKRTRKSRMKNPNDPALPDKTVLLRVPLISPGVFNVNGMVDDLHSILCVLAGQKLSTVLMDAYLTLKLESFNTKMTMTGGKTFGLLPCHFLPVYNRDQDIRQLKPSMSHFPEGDLLNSVLIAPIYGSEHFFLLIIDFTRKTIHIYDPSWPFFTLNFRILYANRLLKCLYEGIFLKSKERTSPPPRENWSVEFETKCAQQMDKYSCGCYVIHYIENYLEGKPEKSRQKLKTKDVKEIRHDTVRTLLPTTNIGINIYNAISH